MKIICSNCSTHYDLTAGDIKGLKNSVMTCKKCRQHIKIVLCPYCRALYSINFEKVDSDRYNLQCKKCGRHFKVQFPLREPLERKSAGKAVPTGPSAPGAGGAEGDVKTRVRPAGNMNSAEPLPDSVKPVPVGSEKKGAAPAVSVSREGPVKQNKQEVQEDAPAHPALKGPHLSAFTLKELFSVCASAFSLQKLLPAAAGMVLMIFTAYLGSTLENWFLSSRLGGSGGPGGLLLHFIPLSLIFFFYVQTAAVVARITIETAMNNEKWNVWKTIDFTGRTLLPVLLVNMLVIFLINAMVVLVGMIPVIGPVFYALLFLPVYLLSIGLFLLVTVGFWFYPPLIAYRNTGVAANARNLFYFIKKHNFSLLYILPVLSATSLLVLLAVYLIHRGGLAFTVLLAGQSGAGEIMKLFAAIPDSLLKIAELSFMGSGNGIVKVIVDEIHLYHRMGGALLGTVLSFLSVVLMSAGISVVATLSTHVYIYMERGIDRDDRKKLIVLVSLTLFLLLLYMLQGAAK